MDPAAFFYTSCVRADGWHALTRFHTDLEYQLRIQEGFGVSGVLGALMDPESARESQVTRAGVMIALYSPRYFGDRGAGIEWAVFRSRMRHHEDTTGAPARGCLIPLCWKPVPDARVPEAVRASASYPGAFEWLRTDGLEALTASGDPAAEERYYALVEQLAKIIAEAGHRELEEMDVADALALDAAFGSEVVPQPRRPVGTRSLAPGTRSPAPATTPRPGTAEPGARSVAISYVGADQPWADWVEDVLKDGGYRVVQHRWRASREALPDAVARARSDAGRLLVLFSRDYFGARSTAPTDWEVAFAEPDAGSPPPVFVQIDTAPRPLLVRDSHVVMLAGSDLAASVRRILDEVSDVGTRRSRGGGTSL
ncbi:TIR domain-containing protein [Streptomyces sp. NPDC056568]|uniref:TIR domain-containing protein n=1 Tax=Streptomyces sp. NPDC056568 TaxID=3345866 RepID=UPI0036CBB737